MKKNLTVKSNYVVSKNKEALETQPERVEVDNASFLFSDEPRQRQFLSSKKSAWEYHEPLTPSELAERKFWKDELKIMVMGSKGNLITSAESKEYFKVKKTFVEKGLDLIWNWLAKRGVSENV